MTGQQALESLPYSVPPIAQHIVTMADLPTDDFAEAFDYTFAPVNTVLEQHDGHHQAAIAAHETILDQSLKGIQDFFHLTTRPFIGTMQAEEGWEIELTSHGAVEVNHVEQCGCCDDTYYAGDWHYNIAGTLRSSSNRVVTLFQKAHDALQVIKRIRQLLPILDGSDSVWSFLPATSWQVQRAQDKQREHNRDVENIKDLIRDRSDIARLHRVARQGQSDEQILQGYLDRFVQKTGEVRVRGIRLEVRTYWTDESHEHHPMIYLDTERDEMEQDAQHYVESAHSARTRLESLKRDQPKIFSCTDEQDLQEIAALEQENDHYQHSKGWPSGYVAPRFDRDTGQWMHFDVSIKHGRWVPDDEISVG